MKVTEQGGFKLQIEGVNHIGIRVDEHDIKITGSFSFGKMSGPDLRQYDHNAG